jgi:hypothetical protein
MTSSLHQTWPLEKISSGQETFCCRRQPQEQGKQRGMEEERTLLEGYLYLHFEMRAGKVGKGPGAEQCRATLYPVDRIRTRRVTCEVIVFC